MAKMIHDTGINMRLPQTPRTPGTAAAHYFDDILSRGITRRGTGMRTPGLDGPKTPRMRRSSTSRSIGNRSDIKTNGDSPTATRRKQSAASEQSGYFGATDVPANSVVSDVDADAEGSAWGQEGDLEKDRGKSEADSHVEKYVREQLARIQTGGSMLEASVFEDEFEAQLD